MGRASVHSNASGRRLFTTSLRAYLGPEKLHPCCVAFLSGQAKSDRHHLRFSSYLSYSQPPRQKSRVFLWPHFILPCGILWMPIHNYNFNVNFTMKAAKCDFCPHFAQEISCGLTCVQWQETQRNQDCQWPPFHLQTWCVQLDLDCLW